MASIQSGGTYTITNGQAGTALDLSGGDERSIIGFGFHGQGNQQWTFEQPQGTGWTIRSVATGKFLDIEGEPGDGTRVVASDCPREWDIWPDDEDSSAFRFFIPNTTYNIDLSDHGNPTPGTPVTLWGKWNGRNQVWYVRPL
ncbi:carbohydrate-binding module family 13 protein [Dentipellis sp. KUC8613]|nr:carbohydrate-binding module family 13 protein [Dentipellis sp. KUC8613]